MIGRTLSHYQIKDKLGEGGMGAVYRAHDTTLDRDVALKVLPEEFLAHLGRLARFEREAKAVAALNHPNIVTIHSIEESEGVRFLTMELVEGETLDELVPSGGLQPQQVFEIGIAVADALGAAHQKSILHRDLKPANIMVTSDGRVKILDFGLAKLTDPDADSDIGGEADLSQVPTKTAPLTSEGVVVGTVPYMPPELLDGRPVDHRGDIFSFGVLLYEAVTGLLPFQGKSGPAVMSAILRDNPRPISELNMSMPSELGQIVSRSLAKEPRQRYQSAWELRDELRQLQSTWQSGATGPPKRQLLKAWWKRMATAAGVAALVALTVLFTTNRQGALVESRPPGAVAAASAFDATDWIIAVMPSSADADRDTDLVAVSEGLVLTLTAKLAQLSRGHDLQVIPSRMLLEEEIDSFEKARQQLGVTLALDFDTHLLGDQIRVNAQLIDVANRRQIAAETIDGSMDDLLALEESVTFRVLRMLRVELRPMEQGVLQAGTEEPKAYNYYLRARGYMQDFHDIGSVDTAVSLYEQALRVDPGYASAYAGLGEALWQRYVHTNEQRWVTEAMDVCSQAVEIDDLAAEGHVCLGTLLNGTGRAAEAVDEFELAKSSDPSLDLAYRGLADAYVALSEPQKAENAYQEAVDVRPHYWAGYNWLGIFYLRRGHSEKAIEQFEEVVRLAPDSYRGYSNLGGAYYYANRRIEARRAFEEALKINPDDDLAASNLGTLYFFEGRFEEATEQFDKAVALNESDYFNWGNLADALHWGTAGEDRSQAAYTEAISLSDAQLRVNPNDVVILCDVAYYKAMLGSKENALELLDSALGLEPTDVDSLHRAAQIYQALGQTEEAERYLRRSIDGGYPTWEIAADPLFSNPDRFPNLDALLTGSN